MVFFLEKFSLSAGFKRYFDIAPALDLEHKHVVFRIRHEVYCEELRYEPIRADGMETDEYDPHALHCLLRAQNPERTPVGCTRLVLTRPDDRLYPLPLERSCEHTIDRSLFDPRKVDRTRIAEVSRLAVRAPYRRRKGETGVAATIEQRDFGTVDQPRFPYIPVSLYLGTVALAARSGIDTLLVLTEPRLAAHFAKLGVEIRQIGGPIEHRGTRVPSIMEVGKILKNLRFMVKPLYKTIAQEIERGYATQHRETVP